jgi:eukaryotic-like serine/threonine-protein kinase
MAENKKGNYLVQYFLSRDFLRQVKYALAIFFGIILFTTISLRVFTRHNITYAVPDFRGLSLIQAKELAEDNNLRVQIMDSVYNQLHKRGTVVEQEPKEGVQVKKYRHIFLVMNAMNPEKVLMPNVVGVSLRQAITLLESNGLITGHLRYVPDIATNNVLKQKHKGKEINPGSEIEKGSRIDLVLGKSNYSESVEMPDLIGLTRHDAERHITQAYLNVGATIYDKSVQNSDDSLNAMVFRQKPEHDTKRFIVMGAIVDIWLTVDKDKIKINPSEKDE